MSHDSYVCGFIKVARAEEALEAINSLPAFSDDDDWPYLTSAMFSFTVSPEYRDRVIHFAASYKDISDSWDLWMAKLEALIEKFEYYEVKILVEDCYKGDSLVRWRGNRVGGAASDAQFCRQIKYETGSITESIY